MTSALPDNWQELMAGYALGDLSPEEIEELQRLIAENPNLRAEVASLQEVLALMPYALPQQEPSAPLRDAILATVEANPAPGLSNQDNSHSNSHSNSHNNSTDTTDGSANSHSVNSHSVNTVSSELSIAPLQTVESGKVSTPQGKRRSLRRGSWASTGYRIGGAIAAVALVALGIDNYRLRQETQQAKSVIAALQQRGTQTIALEGTEAANTASGSLLVAKDQQVFIVAQNLPVLPEGQVYRLWAMPASGKNPTFCGQFSGRTNGSVTTQWVTPEVGCQSTTVQMLITSEKASDPPVPRGSLVMHSRI